MGLPLRADGVGSFYVFYLSVGPTKPNMTLRPSNNSHASNFAVQKSTQHWSCPYYHLIVSSFCTATVSLVFLTWRCHLRIHLSNWLINWPDLNMFNTILLPINILMSIPPFMWQIKLNILETCCMQNHSMLCQFCQK